MLKRKIVAIN